MTGLEPGPGMGFFTTELARMVGPHGQVVAIDVQPRMLKGLRKRLQKTGLSGTVDVRLAAADSLGVQDLTHQIDFIFAYAVTREVPSRGAFFDQVATVTKLRARLLLVEPRGHVKPEEFEAELQDARRAGLVVTDRPSLPRGIAALLKRS